ncbi:SUMF1/EgtB/PvdO family nonheme iron enzyme [bacterium]|nr:SUMF1/EgtB/PvdO family nonheme iron enzyme [bacterium]
MIYKKQVIYSCLTFLLITFAGVVFAQRLGLMEVEQIRDNRTAPIIVTNPDESVLVVQSEVDGLSFQSTRGIRRVDKPASGVYYVHVDPGTNVFTIDAPGFQAITGYRIVMPKKDAVSIRVAIVEPGSGARGEISISTEPPGASITINDLPIAGLTPTTLSGIPTGMNHILLHGVADHESVDTTVMVNDSEQIKLSVNLPRLEASLRVTSNPTDAQVWLDGDLLGITPVNRSDLTPGEKTLVVAMDGYEANTQQIRLSSDQLRTIQVDLFAMTGAVEISTVPLGATVYLDGQVLGEYKGTPLKKDNLELGSHRVHAVLGGHEDANGGVSVEYNKTATVHLTLTGKPGALFVMTTPPGASIILDGRDLNQKSPAKIEGVASGEHNISLKLDGYKNIERELTIEPYRVFTLDINFHEIVDLELQDQTIHIVEKGESLYEISTIYNIPLSKLLSENSLDRSFRIKVGDTLRIVHPRSNSLKDRGRSFSGPLLDMTFVTIPAGSFMMGSPANESGKDDDESPQHLVTISKPFQMMTTEVTQAMWKELMGNNPSHLKGDDLPVEQVSWNDCQDFIKKLNQREPGKGYRLPTEAEWEYACRAGTTTRFYSGDSESDLARAGWFYGNSESKTHAVGLKEPNALGLYNMHGNVWEWCNDWYDEDYYDNSPSVDPSGSNTGSYRVLRGGSWLSNLRYCRSANRDMIEPLNWFGHYGFRIVRSSP